LSTGLCLDPLGELTALPPDILAGTWGKGRRKGRRGGVENPGYGRGID